jgi:hypothetical protein
VLVTVHPSLSLQSGWENQGEMIQENEVLVLLLAVGTLIFVWFNRLRLRQLPSSRTLLAGFYFLIGAWSLTVVEGFFWQEVLNFIEHLCYAVSAVLIATWCWQVFGQEGGGP